MKFNLKNRPKIDMKEGFQRKYRYGYIEEWFEGFEKELRQKLESKEHIGIIRSLDKIKLIKEILGETS